MNSNDRSTAIVVDGVATKYGVEEFDRDAYTVKGVIDLSVTCAYSTLPASKGTRKMGIMPPIVDGAPQLESYGCRVMGLVSCGRANKSSSLFANLSI
jgi:hypothetical protein